MRFDVKNVTAKNFFTIYGWDHFAIPTFRNEKYANVMYFSTLVFSVFKSWIFAEAALHIPTQTLNFLDVIPFRSKTKIKLKLPKCSFQGKGAQKEIQ